MDSNILTSPGRLIASFNRNQLRQERPQVHSLRNEQMVTMLSAVGSGSVKIGERSVTRWQADPTCDVDGYSIYLRDLDSNAFWSATYQPTKVEPDEYQVDYHLGSARFSRRNGEIFTNLDIFLSQDVNAEFRRLTITNLGSTNRRIELTSYAELVLQAAGADAGHPAYSKLFVETWRDDSGALFAKRRPREAGESTLAACHFLVGATGIVSGSFETDRAKFLGRGNTTARPAALRVAGPLQGGLGSVLDPVFSLRQVVSLAPKESACVTFVLAAGEDLAELKEIVGRFDSPDCVEHAFLASDVTASENGNSWNNLAEDETEPSQPLSGSSLSSNSVERSDLISALPVKPIYRPAECRGQGGLDGEEPLQHDNGFGGFSADGLEYIIRLRPTEDSKQRLPPMPWVNIVSNEQAGFIVSETGAGYTWAGNSRLNRLTPWHNDPITDPHGEAIYIRDEDAKTFWSPTPGPVRQPTEYEVRHGFGTTCFRHSSNDFFHEVTQFVPREDAIKISWVRLRNTSDRTRRIGLFSYHQWDLTDGDRAARSQTKTVIDPEQTAVFATNDQRGVFAKNCSFAAFIPPAGAEPIQSTCDRLEFLGHHGDLLAPQALTGNAEFSGRAGQGFDPCAASRASIELAPGESIEFAVVLGEADSQSSAAELLQHYRSPASWSEALDEVQGFWRDRLSAVQIKTPSSAIDLMVNGWLPYQNLSCRMWGRSALYQSGGAYGYRDQLQDSAALIHHWPDLTRQQIVRHAAHQFVEGDVLHWWHPPQSLGIRTMFSDDLLWLPLFSAEYVETTGEEALWQEKIPFLTGPKVPAGEAEIMLTPTKSEQSGTLYEHCCRALDRGLTTGRHGLPLMGCGDWNDGMNRVGLGGTGESVWLGFFIDTILGKMLPVCEKFDDRKRVERYSSYRQQLRTALHDAGWDGGWYRRAYFDDGTPLGTAASDECQIDALVQAWAVLSGAAPTERAEKSMEAAIQRLVDRKAGMIRLLDPPFDNMEKDPGYIKGYVPGVRENGGQYTHGVLWFIKAVAELGQGTRAVELLEMLSPVNHARTKEEVATYQTEPYVVAADVYGQPPHVGRGGWSWYTGSAGWMWRVAVESILGFGIEGGKTLRIDPRIDARWPEYSIRYRLPDDKTCYEITVSNPHGKESGVTSTTLDGEAVLVSDGVARVPLIKDGKTHQVEIVL